jgi:hypothetical protein
LVGRPEGFLPLGFLFPGRFVEGLQALGFTGMDEFAGAGQYPHFLQGVFLQVCAVTLGWMGRDQAATGGQAPRCPVQVMQGLGQATVKLSIAGGSHETPFRGAQDEAVVKVRVRGQHPGDENIVW